jgi:hypothetical protein
MFGHIYNKYGVISAKKSATTNRKKQKFSRSQENEVRRVIFLFMKMLLFIQLTVIKLKIEVKKLYTVKKIKNCRQIYFLLCTFFWHFFTNNSCIRRDGSGSASLLRRMEDV